MLKPYRNKIICEIVLRERFLAKSGIWLADKQRLENKDNICRCMDSRIDGINKRDLIHFKGPFGKKFKYEDKNHITLKKDEIIAIERDNKIMAVGSMVIVKLTYAEKMGTIIVPDTVKQASGDFWGEVVAVGPDYPDKDLKAGDNLWYLRDEGYRFRTWDDSIELLAIKDRWCYGKST